VRKETVTLLEEDTGEEQDNEGDDGDSAETEV